MTERKFFRLQRQFTRYLRDPNNAPVPESVDADGLAVYSRAVISNMEVFVGDNFPIVKDIIAPSKWSEMVRDYFIRHVSMASVFTELPAEFLKYLGDTRDEPSDPPFLYELAHFELLENTVSMDERQIDEDCVDPHGDPMLKIPTINPTTQLVRYAFPVHTINPDHQPKDPPQTPTFIVAFRNRANRFGFMDVNSATARAVELLLADTHQSGEQIMKTIAQELNYSDVDLVVATGREIFNRLSERDVIVGTQIESK